MFLSLVAATLIQAPNQVDGVLTLPTQRAGVLADVRVHAWHAPGVLRAEIGGRLIMVAISAGGETVVNLFDVRRSELVTLHAASNDMNSASRLFALESDVFPLLPDRFGPNANADDFFAQASALPHETSTRARKGTATIGSAAYDIKGDIPGRVSWDYHLDFGEQTMSAWHFAPIQGGARSMRIGEGVLSNGYEQLAYGSDEKRADLAALPRPKLVTDAVLANGEIASVEGPLNNAFRIWKWIVNRTPYAMTGNP